MISTAGEACGLREISLSAPVGALIHCNLSVFGEKEKQVAQVSVCPGSRGSR